MDLIYICTRVRGNRSLYYMGYVLHSFLLSKIILCMKIKNLEFLDFLLKLWVF
jgi:hypothetical protein